MNKLPLSPEWRRALEELATVGESGSSEPVLRARGFSAEMLKSLARVGLATQPGGQLAPRMRITELGRQMLGTIVPTGEREANEKAAKIQTGPRKVNRGATALGAPVRPAPRSRALPIAQLPRS